MARFLKRQSGIAIALAIAMLLILCSLVVFTTQVSADVRQGMRDQTESIQAVYARLVENEVGYLKRLTETAADLMAQAEYRTDADIVAQLKEYAQSGELMRALFLSLDGRVYTSYAGYLGQSDKYQSIDGTPISEIRSTVVTNPVYAKSLDKVIFGVATPVIIGGYEGVLVSSYDVTKFRDLFQSNFLGGNSHIGIVRSDGAVILGEDADFQPSKFGLNIFDAFLRSSTGFSYRTAEGMRQDFSARRADFVIYSLAGIERYCAYAPVAVGDWIVAVMTSENVLRTQTAAIERRGVQLTIELVIIMAVLLLTVVFIQNKEQLRVRSVLQKVAAIDALTGIYNRGAVELAITNYLQGDGSCGTHALFIMDIDRFKSINDTLGHMVGDVVLKDFAKQLQTIFGGTDMVGRMGGDEFIALYTNYETIEAIRAKADQVTQTFCNQMNFGTGKLLTSISIGISLFDSDGCTFTELYQHADNALYQRKQQGKNGYTFFKACVKISEITEC